MGRLFSKPKAPVIKLPDPTPAADPPPSDAENQSSAEGMGKARDAAIRRRARKKLRIPLTATNSNAGVQIG